MSPEGKPSHPQAQTVLAGERCWLQYGRSSGRGLDRTPGAEGGVDLLEVDRELRAAFHRGWSCPDIEMGQSYRHGSRHGMRSSRTSSTRPWGRKPPATLQGGARDCANAVFEG